MENKTKDRHHRLRMTEGKNNLFVYGSLREPEIFKSVSGLSFTLKRSKVDDKTLFAQSALLPHYRKVSPDNVYFYAVAGEKSRIEGFVIFDVPNSAMAEIDKYEGKRYDREIVRVNTAEGLVSAEAYLVTHESMRKHFGDRFHVNLIHELWLRKRIEKFIKKRTRPGERTVDAELDRRAERELLATTERDLVISHYNADAVSDYYLARELNKPRPSIKHLYDDGQAQPFIKNYLKLVVKHALLNQFEEQIRAGYRFELDRMEASDRYFKRSISVLAALQMINANSEVVKLIVQDSSKVMPPGKGKYDLFNYVKYAVRAADSIFDRRMAHSCLERLRSNLHPGLVPLGAEVELSNLGYKAIASQQKSQSAVDSAYDGFKYFHDFGLDVLSWKLGGYIDDHSGSIDRKRRQGFLELAPGRLNITRELSRAATADPWVLNQLINEIVTFYDVSPHSLHLSFQLRKNQIGNQKLLPLGFVKCLFVLGGGLEQKNTGRLWISRMGSNEIIQNERGNELAFARTSKRQWYMGDDEIADRPPAQATTYIQQYKFIRLQKNTNYEPLILCLKGLQLSHNPSDYLTVEQLRYSKRLREQYRELKQWAVEPSKINPAVIGRFVNAVQKGLMSEGHHRPVHELHYIDWTLNTIDVQLKMFNEQIKITGQ